MVDLEYKTLILELVEEFKKTIPENEQELIDAFEKYLYSTIEDLEKSNSKFILKDKDSIKVVLKNMAYNLTFIDLNSKKQQLLPDNNFLKISEISSQIYEIAQDVLNNKRETVKIDSIKEKEQMSKLLAAVKPYNQERAKLLVSEAILDLEFITNPKINILSLRLANLKRCVER